MIAQMDQSWLQMLEGKRECSEQVDQEQPERTGEEIQGS